MALGVGDRPYPGAHVVHEALLKRLGVDDYDKLLKGKLAWSDPRVVDTLKWVRSLTEAGLLPTRSPPSSSPSRTSTSTPTQAR
jgi:multiple sugar transport system substrate-binding protein